MGFRDFFKKEEKELDTRIEYHPQILEASATEAFKTVSVVPTESFITKMADVGEEHPYHFSVTLGLYKDFGFAHGAIDKFVDFIVGGGFYITSDDERAEELINDWLEYSDFENTLRAWLREALITGNAYLEIADVEDGMVGLKQVPSKNVFIERDEKGEVKAYTQVVSDSDNQINVLAKKKIRLEPEQVAHLAINKIGDTAYGIGILYPALSTIEQLIGLQKDMHFLVSRKAGAPLHVKFGTKDGSIIPAEGDLTDLRAKLSNMKNKHEYVTDALVEMTPIDFGKVAENFTEPLKHDTQMLFYTLQIPSVLMGTEGVPEGLANVQLEAFQRRIQSFQCETEPVIEKKILRRFLEKQGLGEAKVEFVWGRPSETQKEKEILRITELLKLFTLAEPIRAKLQSRLAQIMELDVEETEIESAVKKQAMLDARQPSLPPFGKKESYCANRLSESLTSDDVSKGINMSIIEWVGVPVLERVARGFSFAEYLKSVLGIIKADEFEMLRAENKRQEEAGWLSAKDISGVRKIFLESFNKGESLRVISEKLRRSGLIGDLYATTESDRIIYRDGEKVLRLSADVRSIIVAKTEAVRLSNLALLKTYSDAGYERVRWLTMEDGDVCELCSANENEEFWRDETVAPESASDGEIINASDRSSLPRHVNCRCGTIAITESRRAEL